MSEENATSGEMYAAARQRVCGHCKAEQGNPCVQKSGRQMSIHHASRYQTESPTAKTKPDTFPVETLQVNPGIWKTAMELAGKDRSKVQVLAHNKVLVG